MGEICARTALPLRVFLSLCDAGHSEDRVKGCLSSCTFMGDILERKKRERDTRKVPEYREKLL